MSRTSWSNRAFDATIGAVVVTVLATIVASTAFSASAGDARKLDCVAKANMPGVAIPNGWANGGLGDRSSTSTCLDGEYAEIQLSLKNNAGSTLVYDTWHQFGYEGTRNGTSTGCRGAILHSFTYANEGGVGSSDSAGTNSDCAY